MSRETKTFDVYMLANDHGAELRRVVVPAKGLEKMATEQVLSLIFEKGQNDFQPVRGSCSVSMGDVIDLDGELWVVQSLGFMRMTAGDLVTYTRLPAEDRTWSKFVRPRYAAARMHDSQRDVCEMLSDYERRNK